MNSPNISSLPTEWDSSPWDGVGIWDGRIPLHISIDRSVINVLIEFDSLFLVGKESSQVAFVHSALSRLRPTAETETEVVRKHGGTGVGARGRIEMRALALRRTYGRGRTV